MSKVCRCGTGYMSRHDGHCGHCRTKADNSNLSRFFKECETVGVREYDNLHLMIREKYFGRRGDFV